MTHKQEIRHHNGVTLCEEINFSGGEILTVDEVADFMRVKPTRVYSMTRAGLIPHFSLGRQLRFVRSQIMEWVLAGGNDTQIPASVREDIESMRKSEK
jgi:excisionase family DNA binding protein